MTNIAAVYWDIGTRSLHTMMIDANYGYLVQPTTRQITIANAALEVRQAFTDFNSLGVSYELEFKVVNHASPAVRIRRGAGASPVTLAVSAAVTHEITASTNCAPNSQYRRLLRRAEINKVKGALQAFGFINARTPAHRYHLWAIALHITKGNHKAKLKMLWRVFTTPLPGGRTAQNQAFAAWYQQL